MTKVFIGGSRRIGRLNADVRRRLDRIIEKRLPVLIGDANGVDKAVQQHLREKMYGMVEVFCTGEECRNNLGAWPTRRIASNDEKRGFRFHAAKDRAMAREATVGFMIWDGKSVGTLMNISRLVLERKKVVVYVVPEKTMVEVEGIADWEALVPHHAGDLRRRIERELAAEQPSHRAASQLPLL